jgi:hypothetical protein
MSWLKGPLRHGCAFLRVCFATGLCAIGGISTWRRCHLAGRHHPATDCTRVTVSRGTRRGRKPAMPLQRIPHRWEEFPEPFLVNGLRRKGRDGGAGTHLDLDPAGGSPGSGDRCAALQIHRASGRVARSASALDRFSLSSLARGYPWKVLLTRIKHWGPRAPGERSTLIFGRAARFNTNVARLHPQGVPSTNFYGYRRALPVWRGSRSRLRVNAVCLRACRREIPSDWQDFTGRKANLVFLDVTRRRREVEFSSVLIDRKAPAPRRGKVGGCRFFPASLALLSKSLSLGAGSTEW